MPELSIIVPVYKVEKYLPKCIDSIQTQTFSDFELILIDDGSPDRCGEICDEYAAKDSRIVVIHQNNAGVSAARNAGLDIAKGTYIGFVDSDDWIEPNMYQLLVAAAEGHRADVSICGSNEWSENGTLLRSDLQEKGVFDQDQLLNAMYSVPNPLGGILWNKLLRRKNINSVRFHEDLRNCEDNVFLVESFFHVSSGVKIPTPLYNVLLRQNSASRSGNIQQVYHTVCGFVEVRNLLKTVPHNKKLDTLAANMVLDNCVRFGKTIMEIHSNTNADCYVELAGIRKIMRRTIASAIVHRLLPVRRIHGYYNEMRKLRIR